MVRRKGGGESEGRRKDEGTEDFSSRFGETQTGGLSLNLAGQRNCMSTFLKGEDTLS